MKFGALVLLPFKVANSLLPMTTSQASAVQQYVSPSMHQHTEV